MAHIRRGFYEAREQATVRAGWILRQMRHLCALEKDLRTARAGPALREARRASEAAPVLARIKKALMLFTSNGHHLPQSSFGKVLSYALGQWESLTPYLTGGGVEIGRVGDRLGYVRTTASVAVHPVFRFLSPLVEPDLRISRIRLSSPTYWSSHSTGPRGYMAA